MALPPGTPEGGHVELDGDSEAGWNGEGRELRGSDGGVTGFAKGTGGLLGNGKLQGIELLLLEPDFFLDIDGIFQGRLGLGFLQLLNLLL